MIPPRMPIAIVRLDDLSAAVEIAQSLVAGGLTALEYTLTNNAALHAVEQARAALGEAAQIGVGTVLSGAQARDAIAAGAQFLVTPVLRRDVIAEGATQGVPVVCGAYTPTEIWEAWQAGAPFVKLFPARSLGPSFVRDVLAPLPMLKLIPTGGVDLDNCADYLQAGAYSVGIGGNLVAAKLVAARDWAELTRRARAFVAACTRQSLPQ
ncbi:MAG: bifunctional 4-hydroxy-2-oxoglutarate aldolase/2-dehydro-3-deoxy-phosphogluconate aldolase [Roseiflexaceae bacterium]|nr:bifunctional 4-hydroxy-2-oxoglutarate aldolase/2-dehydro-3-deoxy-phosphogluconate aldolase [Roseiflexaceae bacterium]